MLEANRAGVVQEPVTAPHPERVGQDVTVPLNLFERTIALRQAKKSGHGQQRLDHVFFLHESPPDHGTRNARAPRLGQLETGATAPGMYRRWQRNLVLRL